MSERGLREQLEQAQATAAALERGEPDSVVREAEALLAARQKELDAMTDEQVALERQLTQSLLAMRGAQQNVLQRAGSLVPGIHWLGLGCAFACCLSGAFLDHVSPPWALGGMGLISFVLGYAYERRARAIAAAMGAL